MRNKLKSTVDDRAFPVAAARLRNSLPSHVTAVPSLSIFCCRLNSQLFSLSYPTFWVFSHLYSARAVTSYFGCFNYIWHFNTDSTWSSSRWSRCSCASSWRLCSSSILIRTSSWVLCLVKCFASAISSASETAAAAVLESFLRSRWTLGSRCVNNSSSYSACNALTNQSQTS